MAGLGNADEVFVALPATYEDEIPVLSWVLSSFPKDKTKIVIVHVDTTLRIEGIFGQSLWPDLIEEPRINGILSCYLSYCSKYKFRAEKLIHVADDIAQGIVEVIAIYGTKNLVMRSAANSDMTALTSKMANKVMREANRSCKLWFVLKNYLICTREVNSDDLMPTSASEEIFHWKGRLNEASSSTSSSSNRQSSTEEIKLAKKLEQKEEEIWGLRELLEREMEENDQLRQQIEESEHENLRAEIEQIKTEKDLLRGQRDMYINQIQVANDKIFALELQVSDMKLVIEERELIYASAGSQINSMQNELSKLQLELVGKVEELSSQRENKLSSSSIELNSELSLQELQQATQNFSESLKIGQGGFGSVYKGCLRGTMVAIKLLHSPSLQGISQFQQEITILTKVRHPNLVTLIGACSEVSALVYEYLSNGSLEDRLTCANNTPPLTWQARTRIIGEICLALIFLHSNKPQLVVHGDLKPGNILLDTNLVSKLSDFGISRLLKQPDTNSTAFFQTSRPAGTFPYIDPEYLTTGILTPKSDTYSFGIIILRLLTGKSPLNIARKVQDAMRNESLLSVIDESAGTWPFEQAEQLANIALRCVQLSRSHRPDLVNDVWTIVEPLTKAAATCVEPQGHGSEHGAESIPSHFICPISQEVMQEPFIAADGFTYEEEEIREWLRRGHSTSPMTNLVLPHRNLIPNLVLRSAIQDWLQRHPQC